MVDRCLDDVRCGSECRTIPAFVMHLLHNATSSCGQLVNSEQEACLEAQTQDRASALSAKLQ